MLSNTMVKTGTKNLASTTLQSIPLNESCKKINVNNLNILADEAAVKNKVQNIDTHTNFGSDTVDVLYKNRSGSVSEHDTQILTTPIVDINGLKNLSCMNYFEYMSQYSAKKSEHKEVQVYDNGELL